MARFEGPQGRGAMKLYKAKKREEAEVRNKAYAKAKEASDGNND